MSPSDATWTPQSWRTYPCAQQPVYSPCIFEYVYLARPDSVIDGVSVYETRLRMGQHLAGKVASRIPVGEIDVVIPIPDSSRPSAMELAQTLVETAEFSGAEGTGAGNVSLGLAQRLGQTGTTKQFAGARA